MGISRGVGDFAMTPSGVIVPFAGSNSPAGWFLCAGQAVSRTQYAGLFSTIGTTYGVGDGSTTFNLPDLRGRTIAGVDNMGGSAASRLTSGNSGITATTLGATGGDERVHSHNHAFTGTASSTGTVSSGHTHNFTTGYVSHDHAHIPWNGLAAAPGANHITLQYGGNPYNLTTSGITQNHYHGGTTADINQNHSHSFTPSGTNASFGSGNSQNVQPTIVLNYIIKI